MEIIKNIFPPNELNFLKELDAAGLLNQSPLKTPIINNRPPLVMFKNLRAVFADARQYMQTCPTLFFRIFNGLKHETSLAAVIDLIRSPHAEIRKDHFIFRQLFYQVNKFILNKGLLKECIDLLIYFEQFPLLKNYLENAKGADADFKKIHHALFGIEHNDYQKVNLLFKSLKLKYLPAEFQIKYYYIQAYLDYWQTNNLSLSFLQNKITDPYLFHKLTLLLIRQLIMQKKFDAAKKLLLKTILFFKTTNYLKEKLEAQSLIAKILEEQEKWQKSEALTVRLLNEAKTNEFTALISRLTIDLGHLYLQKNEFTLAEDYFKMAINVCNQAFLKNEMLLASANLLEIQKIKGEWQDIKFSLKKIVLHHYQNSDYTIASDYFHSAHFEYLRHNYHKALKHIAIAQKSLKNSHNPHMLIEIDFLEIIIHMLTGKRSNCSNLKKHVPYFSPAQKLKLEIIELLSIENPVKKQFWQQIDQGLQQMSSLRDKFDMLLILITFSQKIGYAEQLKSISQALSKQEKNYFYYEYYYYYFTFFVSKKEIMESYRHVFFETYGFFLKNGRQLNAAITQTHHYIEMQDNITDVFKCAKWVSNFHQWQALPDFFNEVFTELNQSVKLNFFGLIIFQQQQKLKAIFNQAIPSAFINSIAEQTLKKKAGSNYTPSDFKEPNTIQNIFSFPCRNFKTYYWPINQAIECILLFAFDSQDYVHYDIFNAHSHFFTKITPLAEQFIENTLDENSPLTAIIGDSPRIKKLKTEIRKAARTDFPVLITGESGTGKELVAKAIHNLSSRCQYKLIAINAAAIPENLLEAELFGYKKGAFTGANSDKIGSIEAADQSTFFFDEIAELPLPLQAKLLRVIQENEIQRLGDTCIKKINVRFLWATHQNLPQLIQEKRFREDLYYRINILNIHTPPLREHIEDIPALIYHFLSMNQFTIKDPGQIQKLIGYFQGLPWPGNVRELESKIKQFIAFYPELPDEIWQPDQENGLIECRDLFEKQMISRILKENNFNRNQTAEILKISRTHLFKLIKKYNISDSP